MTEDIENKLHEINIIGDSKSHNIVVDPAVYYFLLNKNTVSYENVLSEKYPNKRGYTFPYNSIFNTWFIDAEIADTIDGNYDLEILSLSEKE
ncbi:hypothetical protein EBU71_02350 [bacterium]|nr:hypothetical protein [Candidatus Elulimicrobium humile]